MKKNNRNKIILILFSSSIILSLVVVFLYEGVVAQKSEQSDLPRPIFAQALTAYGAKNYDLARELGLKYARLEGREDKNFLAFIYYWVARVDSIREKPNQAFENLEKAVSFGFGSEGESDGLAKDPQFKILHKYPKWKVLIQRSKANLSTKTESKIKSEEDNATVQAIFEEDQSDRLKLQKINKKNSASLKQSMIELFVADEKRFEQMRSLVKTNEIRTANDFSAAAFVFQHSPNIDDLKLANELAQKGFDLDKDKCNFGWILATTTDRYLWFQGKPQIYGTQLRPANGSLEEMLKTSEKLLEASKNNNFSKINLNDLNLNTPMTNEPFDKSKVSNEDRKKLCVPLLVDNS